MPEKLSLVRETVGNGLCDEFIKLSFQLSQLGGELLNLRFLAVGEEGKLLNLGLLVVGEEGELMIFLYLSIKFLRESVDSVLKLLKSKLVLTNKTYLNNTHGFKFQYF